MSQRLYSPAEVAKLAAGKERTRLEDALWHKLVAKRLPLPQREYRFHPTRKWRFDFAWPDLMLAVEVDGGEYVQGRHSRARGMRDDNTKINEAQRIGWVVLRFVGSQVKSGEALATIESFIEGRREG